MNSAAIEIILNYYIHVNVYTLHISIHRNACQEYGIETTNKVWLHKPQAVIETEQAKNLWDFEITTDQIIPSRRPDMVVIDNETRTATIIENKTSEIKQ